MRNIALAASAAALLSACSVAGGYGQPGHPHQGYAPHCAPTAQAYGAVDPSCHGFAGGVGASPYALSHDPAYLAQGGSHYYPTSHSPTTLAHDAPYGRAVPAAAGYGAPALRGYSQPQGYTYGNLGATWYDVDGDAFGVQGRLGYQSPDILGVEGEASVGIIREEVAPDVDVGVDYQLAGFAVARFPLSETVSVHTRGGYHFTEVEAVDEVSGLSVSANDDGFAYGAGAELRLSPRDALRADYTRYDVDGGGLDSASLAWVRRF